MSGDDWTRGRLWFLDGDCYNILAKTDKPWPIHIAEVDDRDIEADEAKANARRICAAINATRDCTTEGLESAVAKGLTLKMALEATLKEELL